MKRALRILLWLPLLPIVLPVAGLVYVLARIRYEFLLGGLKTFANSLSSAVQTDQEYRFLRLFPDLWPREGPSLVPPAWLPALTHTSITAELADHRVIRIGYTRVPRLPGRSVVHTVFGVQVAYGVPWFRVVEELGTTESDDVQTGCDEIDDAFVLLGQEEAVRRLFRSRKTQVAVRALFADWGAISIELRDGTLKVEFAQAVTDSKELEAAFGLLLAVAGDCERKPVELKVSGKSALAFLGEGDSVVCPYCRADVSPAEDDAMSCVACNTVHHTACYREANGCTIYACKRQAPVRT